MYFWNLAQDLLFSAADRGFVLPAAAKGWSLMNKVKKEWKVKRSVMLSVILGAWVLACVAMPGRAQADSFKYLFDYVDLPPHTAASPPVPGGPFGTITISDNILHPNRVNIDLDIQNIPAPYNGVALEQFYLNFANDSILSGNNAFYLVTQGAADPPNINGNPFPVADRLGGVQKGNDTQVLAVNFTFDVNPDPTSGNYLFQGSLAFYDTLPSPDTPINLDASMFDLASGGTGLPPMFAAFRLVPGPSGIGEFFAFASTRVPEPSTLLLLGSGLIALAAYGRKRFVK